MIELTDVKKDYGKGDYCTHALQGITMKVERGEYVAIVGTSGSGKSTLLHIIGGMDQLTSGVYRFADEVVSDYSLSKLQDFRKRNISFIFQNFALMNKYTVFENVEMPLLARNIKKRKQIVMDCLERVGIANLKSKLPTQLSGGQQQRCAIARALASDTQVILADEPTGALDNKTSSEIMSCFSDIHEAGHTVILITHDMSIASKCQRIVRIEDGKIV
ncbi:ABC transporter ATP-binding protein [Ruminococcus flavefaciens]|uniref:Putative ABC transport system ATP-binding protein n=1 Tax=Ruminococcus flavefaciens TaxID=1265 RepID=A0A315XSM2_RUMFL|nr:ABC transporter ATP-binding protein [Ruminococcus flavefaciens]PWJ09645.1 putative ABC transport system ATP-binding protein [Ruminococcus flavefaciens]SSA52310.1 putative ABC transport system ATP-binding protein [Ruminococcus flavefaciens]